MSQDAAHAPLYQGPTVEFKSKPQPATQLTFVLVLQASAKRVVLLYSSMVRRRACCAPVVMLCLVARAAIQAKQAACKKKEV
jgi:hypothetical protein